MSKKKLNENYVDLQPINKWESAPEETYETKFKAFLAEQAAEAKSTAKEVEEVQSHAFDYSDTKNIDNLNGQEFMNGVYFESKNSPAKTLEEVREVVAKNLTKDSLHYVKEGQFGEKGVGYSEPVQEEVTGDHASSGYSAKLKKVVKESLMGGMVVTTGNPNSFAAQQGRLINSIMNEDESIYDEDMPMDEDARTDAEEEGYLDGMRDEKYDMSEELEDEKEKDSKKSKDGKT
ncbi:MAG: hypothetical protein ACKVK6_14525, partial [bacterium]